jgi:hypothetical protein
VVLLVEAVRCRCWGVGLALTVVALNVGVNSGKRCETLEGCVALLVLGLLPASPRCKPGVEVGVGDRVDVKVPLDRLQPLLLERVKLRNSNAADLGPGSVLEGVVIEELASQEQSNG